ncbi:hypothetical protein CYMTET_34086 [Cymbomonas tetramitiformis]|uniref:Uncharacterized protein n=1 Tax=Cymbomonas tetramitiformis TaxID=36881 RepID=A0AAE0KQ80_9CHLO|nr:hypothetical protein CYMTET_34086 [Cymbomonas tetramitiformis]
MVQVNTAGEASDTDDDPLIGLFTSGVATCWTFILIHDCGVSLAHVHARVDFNVDVEIKNMLSRMVEFANPEGKEGLLQGVLLVSGMANFLYPNDTETTRHAAAEDCSLIDAFFKKLRGERSLCMSLSISGNVFCKHIYLEDTGSFSVSVYILPKDVERLSTIVKVAVEAQGAERGPSLVVVDHETIDLLCISCISSGRWESSDSAYESVSKPTQGDPSE